MARPDDRVHREEGYDGTFAGTRYRYLDLGGFTFWVSRAVFPPYDARIVNRRPIEDA